MNEYTSVIFDLKFDRNEEMKDRGEVVQWLGALAALEEDQVWFSAPTWQLTTIQNSSARGSQPSSGLLRHQANTQPTYTHAKNNKNETQKHTL